MHKHPAVLEACIMVSWLSYCLETWKYVSAPSQRVASKLLTDLKSMIRHAICNLVLEYTR